MPPTKKHFQAPNFLLPAFILATVVATVGCGSKAASPAEMTARPSPVPGVGCLGRILPGVRVIRVSAPAQSIVKQLKVRRGDTVTVGQELAILQGYDVAAAALAEARQQVAVAESVVAQARATEKPAAIAAQESAARRQRAVVENAQSDFDRKQQLYRDQLIPATELEAAKFALDTARQDLQREEQLVQNQRQVREEDVLVAQRQLALAQARVAHARADLQLNRILSPTRATVLEINAYPGETVTDQGIADLGDTSKMFVEAEVYISDVPRVRLNANARITGEGFKGTLSGKVSEILNQVTDSRVFPRDPLTAADKRVLGVRIQLDNPEAVRHLSNSEVSVHIEP